MAQRFVAILDRKGGASQPSNKFEFERDGYVEAFSSANCRVHVSDAQEFVGIGRNGAVIGNLFRRSDNSPVRSLSAGEIASIAGQGTRFLIANFWGSYVAVLTSAQHDLAVMRDPSGGMPCYYIEEDKTTVVTSDVETAWTYGFLNPQIDWAFLKRHLMAFDLRTSATGLVNVHEILSGSEVTFTTASRRPPSRLVWNPWDFTPTAGKCNERELANKLENVIRGCVQAWIAKYPNCLVSVSGGLDSSVVAAAAKPVSDRMTLLTFATHEAEGDERTYARRLAHHLSLPLTEAFHDLGDIHVDRCSSGHLPRPMFLAFGQSELKIKTAMATSLGIDAFVTGIGGDNVFCHLRSASPALDRLYSEGAAGFFKTSSDICEMTGCSIKDVVTMAVSRAMRKPAYRWQLDRSFVAAPHALDMDTALSHPWLTPRPGALAGKAAHVAMLLRIQGTIEGFDRKLPPLVNPLLSQPIVEACLSVPTWQWCAGGRDRAPVRNAFAAALPAELTARRSKGGPDAFGFDVVEENRGEIREILFNGLLAQHGVLDVAALEECLKPEHPIAPPNHIRLMMLAEMEAWCRLWSLRRNS